jgi:hypothetical protein
MEDQSKPPDPRPSAALLNAMVPPPVVMLIAVANLGLLIWHVIYDATHADYSNTPVTFLLVSVQLFILGVPIGKALRGLQ